MNFEYSCKIFVQRSEGPSLKGMLVYTDLSLTAVLFFDYGYVGRQPVAYGAE